MQKITANFCFVLARAGVCFRCEEWLCAERDLEGAFRESEGGNSNGGSANDDKFSLPIHNAIHGHSQLPFPFFLTSPATD